MYNKHVGKACGHTCESREWGVVSEWVGTNYRILRPGLS
jgi:hypothetical protein